MEFFKKIYKKSPNSFQNIMISFYGLVLKKQRYGKEYSEYLECLRSKDATNYDLEKKKQDEEFIRFVKFAYDQSPFYKEFYKNIDLLDIQGVDDIKKLPILEKETVRQNIDKMYTLSLNEGIQSNTSGTTGKSMMFVYTKEDMQKRMAYLDFFRESHGFINNGTMRSARFNAKPIVPPNSTTKIFWRDNFFMRQRIYSGFHTKGDDLKYYVDNLNKFKPTIIEGYPSCIFEVARYIVNNNIKLKFMPKAIFPTAETLLPHYRTMMEKAFKCPVRNQYASSEGAPFITECALGKLHYNMDTGVIEVGEDGDMLVTCFHTYGTPLIRYRIGDRVKFSSSNEKCGCGSCHPIIDEIEGRGVEFLISKIKGRISAIHLSLSTSVMLNSIKYIQYIQNSLDQIDIFICADETYKEFMDRKIEEELRYSFGSETKFVFHHVDKIPQGENGKFRMVINNIEGIV